MALEGQLFSVSYSRINSSGVVTNYKYTAPPCSNYEIVHADVDREGSGRNELTGEMFRERVGHYCSISMTWDLIPNSKEYNDWYKILTNLPSKFQATCLMPSDQVETLNFYRTDVNTKLYLFVKDRQVWQGLSTSFVQWDVIEYDETEEPILEFMQNEA